MKGRWDWKECMGVSKLEGLDKVDARKLYILQKNITILINIARYYCIPYFTNQTNLDMRQENC